MELVSFPFVDAVAAAAVEVAGGVVAAVGFAVAVVAAAVWIDEDLIVLLVKACLLEMILLRELAVWILLIVSVYISKRKKKQTNNDYSFIFNIMLWNRL